MNKVRIPLYIKLLVSYLLVVGMVLLPTLVYLRTSLSRDARNQAQQEMQVELVSICQQLGDTTPAQLIERATLLSTALPRRLTVVDRAGRVLADSARTAQPPENHSDRPEIRAAMGGEVGVALRVSRTTGQSLLYVAMRFPRTGSPRGVARLARAETSVFAARDRVTSVLRSASAVALSGAVLLSLVAAIVGSRPLRRIAQHARALADGDFGAPTNVQTNDEIGEVADALGALAGQLRTRLIASGAEHATLQALLDDIPVGVVLYDAQRKPKAVNGVARALAGLEPFAESERATELTRLNGQGSAITRALTLGFTVEVPITIPWKPDAALRARWVIVFGLEGERLPALVLLDRSEAQLSAATEARSAAVVASARACLDGGCSDDGRALLARELLVSAPLPSLASDPLSTIVIRARELVALAVSDVAPVAIARSVRIEVALADGEVALTDHDDRLRRALGLTLLWALDDPRRAAVVSVSSASLERSVRVTVSASRAAADSPPQVASMLRPIGGDAGVDAHDEGSEGWVEAPRA